MNTKQVFSLLVFSLCFSILAFGQDQIRIMDSNEESVGRFRTQLYTLSAGKLDKLRGNAPSVDASGSQVEFVLRLKDLKWFDKSNVAVQIKRSDIVVSDPTVVQVASSPTSFTLDGVTNKEVDIKFRVLKNGKYSLKVPFTSVEIKGQYLQSFEVEGLNASGSVETPVGAIADIEHC